VTPREAAKEHIRFYVLRGDTQEYIRSTLMGTSCAAYRAQIGNYLWTMLDAEPGSFGRLVQHLRPDQIGVSEAGGVPCAAVFSLPELWTEIEREKGSGLRQVSLFEALEVA
jgi:hypothetical protein